MGMAEGKKQIHEIAEKGQVEFQAEKQKLIDEAVDKEKQKHERRMKQIETKAAIQKSLAINKQRLEKIKARQDVIANISKDVEQKLERELQNDGNVKTFVTKLITQGLLMLLENNVTVKCRKKDSNMVSSIVGQAAKDYAAVIQKETGASKECKVTVDQNNFLPETSLGGVVLSCQNGNIIIDNTIDVRLKLVMEQDKPAIRRLLFPQSRN